MTRRSHPNSRWLFVACGIFTILSLYAQPGSLDLSFDPGVSVDGRIIALAVQQDGKILVGGAFTQYQGVPRGGLARLYPDGTIDLGYVPPTLYSPGMWQIASIAVDQSGGCLIGGSLFIVGLGARTLVRLHENGTIDTTFDQNLSSGPSGYVDNIVLQENGDIIISGRFTGVSGHARTGIAELYSDGLLNTSQTFEGGFVDINATDMLPSIKRVLIGANQDIYVLGSFTHYGWSNQPARGLARISSTGVLLQQYNLTIDAPGGPANLHLLQDLSLETNGSVLVAGSFTNLNGINVQLLARFLPDGQVDPTLVFDPESVGSVTSPRIWRLLPDGNGGYYALGDLLEVTSIASVIHLANDGSPSSSFQHTPFSDNVTTSTPFDLCLTESGDLLVTGPYIVCGGIFRNGIARIHGLYGLGFWHCLNTTAFTLPANDSLALAGDSALWHELVVEECMQLTIRTCDGSGVEQFGGGLYTSCPAYADSMLAYTEVVPNICGGEDRILDDLLPGTYWLPIDSITGPYSLTLHTVLCGPADCLGVPGGPAQPGSPCDDGDATTLNDTWSSGCVCMGQPDLNLDCAGVPEGSALPGTPCDDGIYFTTNDSWTTDCQCAGYDCAWQQGGSALPGTPCDDLDPTTAPDIWSVACQCGSLTGMAEAVHGPQVVAIRPNPVQGQHFEVLLDRQPTGPLTIRLMDASARLVQVVSYPAPTSSTIVVDRSRIPAGFYLVELLSMHGRSVHRIVLH